MRLALATIVLSGICLAQNTSSIQGTVVDRSDRPLIAHVAVQSSNLKVLKRRSTARDGKFVVTGLKPGWYRLSLSSTMRGFVTSERWILVSAGDNTVKAVLAPKPSSMLGFNE